MQNITDFLIGLKNRLKFKYMDNRIPLIINYDLEGYRGCGVTEFPLSFRVIDGKVIGSYSNDKAGYT